MNKRIVTLEQLVLALLANTKELAHGLETKEWLIKLRPRASWHLRIAALAHDIERAVPYEEGKTPKLVEINRATSYYAYKKAHAERSATVMQNLMKTLRFSSKDIQRVTNAIALHEEGGDPDSNLVRDADSMRWFDSGHIHYIRAYGIEGAKEKGLWMYQRASPRAQKLIKELDFDSTVKDYILAQDNDKR